MCNQELVGRIERNPKTDREKLETVKCRRSGGTIGRTKIARAIVHTASTVDAVRSQARSLGISYILTGINLIPISDPFPRVTVHIMEPPIVWLFEADRMSLFVSVFVEPSVLAKQLSIIAEAKRRWASSAASILPFRFGW